eukprot:CAMPEP_0168229936 /NCGR_PEP_ID=MMETSP0140_2-20121125/15585_1 /TAXON_ID=44445 /ORGANISM="Pseudo-nitzschia australis, Strain 10249 10 AB" /LENGTH=159 /DNA_ID=CAMNT_0008161869 /DNA_START=228 /DNA_END=707 /DNA_ORIENTATION=-
MTVDREAMGAVSFVATVLVTIVVVKRLLIPITGALSTFFDFFCVPFSGSSTFVRLVYSFFFFSSSEVAALAKFKSDALTLLLLTSNDTMDNPDEKAPDTLLRTLSISEAPMPYPPPALLGLELGELLPIPPMRPELLTNFSLILACASAFNLVCHGTCC